MLLQRLDHRQFSVFSTELPSLSAKNSISASDSSLAENPIKAWAIHTPSLSRRGRLWTPGHTNTCHILIARGANIPSHLPPPGKHLFMKITLCTQNYFCN